MIKSDMLNYKKLNSLKCEGPTNYYLIIHIRMEKELDNHDTLRTRKRFGEWKKMTVKCYSHFLVT